MVVKNYSLIFVENQCKECFWPTPDWLHARLNQDCQGRRHDKLSGTNIALL